MSGAPTAVLRCGQPRNSPRPTTPTERDELGLQAYRGGRMRLVVIAAALHMAGGALLHGPSPARAEPRRQRLPRRDVCTAAAAAITLSAPAHAAEQAVRMAGLNGPGKSKFSYGDFETTNSGLQIKEFKPGSGGRCQGG